MHEHEHTIYQRLMDDGMVQLLGCFFLALQVAVSKTVKPYGSGMFLPALLEN